MSNEHRALIQAYAMTFETAAGKTVFSDLVATCDGDTFVRDDPSGRLSDYKQGQRSVLLRIRHYLKAARGEAPKPDEEKET